MADVRDTCPVGTAALCRARAFLTCLTGNDGCSSFVTSTCAEGLFCERSAPPGCVDPGWAEWPMSNSQVDVSAGAPNLESYTVNGDRTVTDNVTGLMWQQDVSTTTYSQMGALAYCPTSAVGGYHDWRLHPHRARLDRRLRVVGDAPADQCDRFPVDNSGYFLGIDGLCRDRRWTVRLVPNRLCVSRRDEDHLLRSLCALRTWDRRIKMNSSRRRLLCVTATFAVGLGATAGASTPAGRYSTTAATVYDTKTKLTWQRGSSSSTLTWADAKTYCTNAGTSLGGAGWRLPTVKEILTLVDYAQPPTGTTAMVDSVAFPSTPLAFFWTSSPAPGNSGVAWMASLTYGVADIINVAAPFNVRCVR